MRKTFYGSFKNKVNYTSSKILRSIKMIAKSSVIHLKIHSIKHRIKDVKIEIGSYVYNNEKEFNDNHYLSGLFIKIIRLEAELMSQREQLPRLQKDEES